jgi:hypothetical protein
LPYSTAEYSIPTLRIDSKSNNKDVIRFVFYNTDIGNNWGNVLVNIYQAQSGKSGTYSNYQKAEGNLLKR